MPLHVLLLMAMARLASISCITCRRSAAAPAPNDLFIASIGPRLEEESCSFRACKKFEISSIQF
jgi:hypothetical protein